MKAAYYLKNGAPDVLVYGDLPDPVATEGHVVIKVEAISIEGGDVLSRRNVAPITIPHVGGYAAAGTIQSIGEDVHNLSIGQRVACFCWSGSHAELFAVPASFVFPVPDTLSLEAAGTGLIAFGTAHDALFEFGHLKAGDTVLIQGAAGGVGLAAVQLAKRSGATVIATASSPERLERLRSFGADHGIDYRQDPIGKRALQLTDGRGVDMVIDLAGGKNISSLMEALRYRGRFVVVGGASGESSTFTAMDVAMNSLEVIGVLFGKELHKPRVHQIITKLFEDMASGGLSMPIDCRFRLADAAAAHQYAEGGHPFGRIVMIP